MSSKPCSESGSITTRRLDREECSTKGRRKEEGATSVGKTNLHARSEDWSGDPTTGSLLRAIKLGNGWNIFVSGAGVRVSGAFRFGITGWILRRSVGACTPRAISIRGRERIEVCRCSILEVYILVTIRYLG